MTQRLRYGVLALHWSVGLIVLWQSWQFVFHSPAVPTLGQHELPHWVRPVLGGTELFAAVLFLIPFTTKLGGRLLLVVFALVLVPVFMATGTAAQREALTRIAASL